MGEDRSTLARLSDAWLDELRSRVDIVDLVSSYVHLKPRGRKHWGLCPFHNEKTASFSVDAASQLFYCFGCHKGGTVIHFVMEMERMEFMDAVKMLAERVHMQLPESDGRPGREADKALREQIFEANRAAALYFHELLWSPEGAEIRAYLHRRGLDDLDIRRYGLGASGKGWNDLETALTQKGYSPDVLEQAGLVVKKEHSRYDMFRGRAIFPIISAQGRVLGFGGRAMEGAQPKYLNTQDTPVFNKRRGLYAMNLVRGERGLKRLILVEGYMDVVSLRKSGVEGVVATLGTALTGEQVRLMKRYVPEVYLSYDGDVAGQNATLRGLELCEEQGLACRVLSFPEGLDPDEYIRKYGLEGFEKLRPLSSVEYRMQREADGVDMSDQEQRMAYAVRCCGVLRKVSSPVEREMYLGRLARETGFSEAALREQLGVMPRQEENRPLRFRSPRREDREESEAEKAQRTLLYLLSAGQISRDVVQEEDFDDPLYRRMAAMLMEGRSGAAVLDNVPEEDRERAARALSREVLTEDPKALNEARDCLRCIREQRADSEIARLQQQLGEAKGAEKSGLLRRIQEIQRDKQAFSGTGGRE
jgi:DNA primase